ncbi:PQQ-binding-like beta-propeller repeat protein [Streptosporangium oxazolinicum]
MSTRQADTITGTLRLAAAENAMAQAPADWTTFGHDLANTRTAQETTLSAANIGSVRTRWNAAGAAVTGTPAIVGGIAYYSDFDGYLHARNATTGAQIWRTRLRDTMLPGSPYVSGDSVYVAGDAGFVYAVNRATGQRRWGVDIESTPNDRIWSSPVLAGNTVIVGTGSYQVFIEATPVYRGSVVGLDPATGRQKWRASVCDAPCTGVSVWSSAAVDLTARLAYIGTGQSYYTPAGPMSDALVAINIDTGRIVWSRQFTAGDSYTAYTSNPGGRDYDIGAAPNLFAINGRAVVGVGDKGGMYKVFDRLTGALIWERRVSNGTPLGGVEHTTAYASGTIYGVANTSINPGDGRSSATPNQGAVWALDAATGTLRWFREISEGGFGGVAVANGLMYFTTWEGTLRVHRISDGVAVLNRYIGLSSAPTPIERGSASGPSISGGLIYVGYGWTWDLRARGGVIALGL